MVWRRVCLTKIKRTLRFVGLINAVCRPDKRSAIRQRCCTVCRPDKRSAIRQRCCTVCRPDKRSAIRQRCCTVCRPDKRSAIRRCAKAYSSIRGCCCTNRERLACNSSIS
ncbi:hypothetical protein [Citrobacter koseri]|uniref:hypothetical protein n=1 Tax=Citrobacter koseri TaxID=545 RepID=UPI0010FE4BB0|nr:hypothetical protein [Citrobacter koseri]HEM8502842.1 hypothetical protein [Citrobacter koseri]